MSSNVVRVLLGDGIQGYHPAVAHALGSVAAAIFVEHVCFWQEKSDDGWAYRTQEEIQERTALGRSAQESARKLLEKKNVLEWKKRGVPCRLYYRINHANLQLLLQSAETVQTRVRESRKQESTSSANYLSKEVSKEVSNTPEGAPATPDATPDEFIAYLAEELTNVDIPLLAGRKARYGKEFKEQLGKDTTPNVLYKAADRIVERWLSDDHRKLTVEQAVEDVVNGKAPAHIRTVKSRLPAHEQWKEKAAGNYKLYAAPSEPEETEEEKVAKRKRAEERMAEFRRMKETTESA
jgi:hypothetical protein